MVSDMETVQFHSSNLKDHHERLELLWKKTAIQHKRYFVSKLLKIAIILCTKKPIANAKVARQPCTSKTDFDVKLALKVILGHLFCNQLQADKGQHIAMQYCWFYLGRFRRSSHTNRQNLPSSTTPLSFDVPAHGNPREHPHKPYISRNQIHWPTFLSLIVWVYLHSHLCSGLQTTHLFCDRVRFGRSRSFKVIQGHRFWYQSKAHRPTSII